MPLSSVLPRPHRLRILLGQICLVIGALMFGGGVIAYGAGSLPSMLIVTPVRPLDTPGFCSWVLLFANTCPLPPWRRFKCH